MRNLAHMEVKGRVAETLLLLKKRFGQNRDGFLNITLTRQDMASFAGTTYETVFRVMSDLVADKLIKVSGKKTGILKEAQLLALVGNE
jgi:CRP/FNR family transcriptional regulator